MVSSTNLRKAAILLASLPPHEAEQLLSRFDSQQVQALTAELIRLGKVEKNEERAICPRVLRRRHARGARATLEPNAAVQLSAAF